MTVEAYLRSLVIGFEMPDEVLERCARSPIEVDLEPLDLKEDIDAVRKDPEPEPEPEPPVEEGGVVEGGDTESTPVVMSEETDIVDNVSDGNSGDNSGSGDIVEGEGSGEGEEVPTEPDPEAEKKERIKNFQMRLDYASSNIYYAVLGVFSGGGYSEAVGDVKVTRSSFVITMADRERFKKLGDMLRRKWGWDVEDESESGIMDMSYMRSVDGFWL